jgi:hypothetical protein
MKLRIGFVFHRAKLQTGKLLPPVADPPLPEQHWPGRAGFDDQSDERAEYQNAWQ